MKPSAAVDFNPKTASAAARNSSRSNPGRQLRQVLDAQLLAITAAKQPDLEPKDLAQLLRAHADYTRLVSELTGRGKPKSVPARNDPTAKPAKSKPVTPTETPQ